MFKRMTASGGLALCAMLGVAGCVSTYVQPADSPDVAHITYNRMPGLEGLGHVQQLILSNGAQCERIQQLDSFSPISSNFGKITERQVRLPGGARTYLVTLTVSSGGMGYSRNCSNMASFTPRAGGRYGVTQQVLPTRCEIEVIDIATGAPPADLQFHPAIRACTANLE